MYSFIPTSMGYVSKLEKYQYPEKHLTHTGKKLVSFKQYIF